VNQTLFDSRSSWSSFAELVRASLPAPVEDTEETLPIAAPPPPESPAQQIEEAPAPETAEKSGEEEPPPDLRAAAAALHACLPDGERVPSERLLERATLRLGYRASSRKVRRALGKALAADRA